MTFIVVSRNPRTKKLVVLKEGEEDHPLEFHTREGAETFADRFQIFRAWGYEVIEVLM